MLECPGKASGECGDDQVSFHQETGYDCYFCKSIKEKEQLISSKEGELANWMSLSGDHESVIKQIEEELADLKTDLDDATEIHHDRIRAGIPQEDSALSSWV